MNQLCVCVCVCVPFFLSLPPSSLHPTSLGHHRALSLAPCVIRQLPTSYLFYIWSPNSSHPPLFPTPRPHVCSPCLHLYFCPANRFISSIFLNSIYMHSYMIFAFLFLTYFTLNDQLWVHPHHCKWSSFIPFYGWVIIHSWGCKEKRLSDWTELNNPLTVCTTSSLSIHPLTDI